jgi:hypothetical protein
VKGEYGGEGGLREVFYGRLGGLILGALGFAERSGVLEGRLYQYRHRGCWRF